MFLKLTYTESPGSLVKIDFWDSLLPQFLIWQTWGRDWDFNKFFAAAAAAAATGLGATL